ncbi:hypothetical protein [Gemmata obscuriglobus]|uniref:hypothetical protein n=1 Tax=Gemmata obscuriglobus TaxID=114 RepID=UPI0011CE0ECA|nr:hypothetical protein [Gemmata obscuriglobus]
MSFAVLNPATAAFYKLAAVDSILKPPAAGTQAAHLVDMRDRLNRFPSAPPDRPAHIDTELPLRRSLRKIVRGENLLEAALLWDPPSAGASDTDAKKITSGRRGLQWKLVMAYGGFELLAKAVLNRTKQGLGPNDFTDLVGACVLPAFNQITVPALTQQQWDDWFDGMAAPDDYLDFLGVDGGDKNALQSWLRDGIAVTTWPGCISLAKALRNPIAHGSLSPRKVNEWKLTEAIKRLPSDLAVIAAAALTCLTL